MPIHLHIVYCCFHMAMAELSRWDRKLTAHQAKVLTIWHLQDYRIANPILDTHLQWKIKI